MRWAGAAVHHAVLLRKATVILQWDAGCTGCKVPSPVAGRTPETSQKVLLRTVFNA